MKHIFKFIGTVLILAVGGFASAQTHYVGIGSYTDNEIKRFAPKTKCSAKVFDSKSNPNLRSDELYVEVSIPTFELTFKVAESKKIGPFPLYDYDADFIHTFGRRAQIQVTFSKNNTKLKLWAHTDLGQYSSSARRYLESAMFSCELKLQDQNSVSEQPAAPRPADPPTDDSARIGSPIPNLSQDSVSGEVSDVSESEE